MVYSEKKKSRYGEPLYLIRFDTQEEANTLWKSLRDLQEHGGLSSEGKEVLGNIIALLEKRCLHNEKYDEENMVSTMVYSSEIGSKFVDLLLLCSVFSDRIKELEDHK